MRKANRYYELRSKAQNRVIDCGMRRRFASLAVFASVLLAPALAYASVFDDLQGKFTGALNSNSYGLALAVVFLAGIGTSLTPCVYPMIAITVSVFGARQAKSRMEGATLSTAFVLGIATLFTPLGLFAAHSKGYFGEALSKAPVLISLAILFSTFAASMFGAFEMNLPPALQNRLAQVGGVGVKGAFALGLVSSVIAAPCAGPVVGALLTWISTTGNVVFGGVALFVYALGLGLLTWCVGTFSISLPKSGHWLEWVKSIFGIVMLVAAIYYVRDLVPGLLSLVKKTPLFLGTNLVFVIVGIALGAVHLSFHYATTSVKIRKALGIVLATVGLAGSVGYAQALPEGAKIAWMHDLETAKAQAKSAGKPLLVDFGASWCGACGELDRHTFSDPRVVAEAERFVAVHIDLSPGNDTPRNREALQSYGERGLPIVVMNDASGQESARIKEFVTADVFLTKLRAVH